MRSTKRPAAPATRSVTVPAPEDLELAADDALLQLRIGRSAHLYAVLASAALALDGVLLLFFYPNLPSLPVGRTGGPALADSFYLLLPLLGGLAISIVGVASKWEAYQLWPWELHFSVSVAAVGANVAIAAVYGLRVAGVGSFAALSLAPWFYPIELAGISLAFVGIALTWNAWTFRQWSSALTAGLPVATALLVYFPPATATGASIALAVSLFLSAILFLTSGSLLHLMSSGTRSHERALITSGQSRMFRLADDLRQREAATQFREAALVKREADVENSLLSIKRQNGALTEGRQQLDDLEAGYRERSDSLVAKERMWAGQVAELDARQRLLEDQAKALALREDEVARLGPQYSAREERLVAEETRLAQREVELAQRDQALARRASASSESEARLTARSKELDLRMADVVQRETEMGGLAAAIALSDPSAASTAALTEREAKLQKLKAVLDEQNLALGRTARQASEKAAAADQALQQAATRESGVVAREAAVRQRESELASARQATDERRGQYETAARDYQSRVEALRLRESEAAQKRSDLDRTMKGVTEREAASSERERRIAASTADLERRDRDLTSRERALEAREAEVSLRLQATGAAPDLPIAGLAAMAVADRLDTVPSSRPSLPDTLQAPSGRRFPDRLPTGTPRLDDLLLGGLPPAGHVVVLGDPFVGKEVVLYAFLAEGLKHGEPAVLVTASRSPEEVAESLGVVLPQFREYEQMGMVRWIDASGSGGATVPGRAVVKGSDDRTGILSSLVAASQEASARGGRFRVGFLGLSTVLAHGEERVGLSFLQNVVGILKPRRALAMYSLEAGALSEPQVETLLSRMDGAIVFRQDRDRTFLAVKGFGEVETHDWVECRATQRSLIIGSFALERIR